MPPLIISLCFQTVFQVALLFISADSHKQAGQLVLLLFTVSGSQFLCIVGVQKTKIMASGPITSWQIDGETMETDRLYLLRL